MTYSTKDAQAFATAAAEQVRKTQAFLTDFSQKRKEQSALQAFDSLVKQHPMGEAVGEHRLPDPLKKLLNSKAIKTADAFLQNTDTGFDNLSAEKQEKLSHVIGSQAIFDGIELGMAEYAKRNGGDTAPAHVILDALYRAVNSCTEHSEDPKVQQMLDSLSFDHHEALSVVPAQITVTIFTAIANSLPIVAQLPNPTGSNELPLVYGRSVTNMRMGAMQKGEYIDGDKAGMPYLENRHTLQMEKAGATFSLDVHVGYNKVVNANHSIGFKPDTSTIKAPFLGGRVKIMVKGVEVANDHYRSHATHGGTTKLNPIGDKPITIDGKQYLVQTGTADLDNHKVTVTFDGSYTEPQDTEVHVQVIFDYERKDANGRDYILDAPGLDMTFSTASVYASPMRAKATATIDAVTQMRNELKLDWHSAVVAIIQNKYFLEQNARLLREQVLSSLQQSGRTITFDAQKTGVQYTNFFDVFSAIRTKITQSRAKLSQELNFPVGAVDIFVGEAGANVFTSLPATEWTATNVSYGDNFSIYRIGALKDGTHVYYVPSSLGWLDEAGATTTATALLLPRPSTPSHSPFVGHTAVSPVVLPMNYGAPAFEEKVSVYARMGADRNPNPMFNNQGVLIQMMNLPSI